MSRCSNIDTGLTALVVTSINAAVLRDPTSEFTIEKVTLDQPRTGELMIRVVGAGLCHTDLLARSMPAGHYSLPMIFGHEGSGVVVETGPGVSAFRPGDIVVVSFTSCGQCELCLRGEPAYCVHFNQLNVSGTRLDGSPGAVDAHGAPVNARWFGQSTLAEYALVNERSCVAAPADAPLELLGPLGCGVQTGAATVVETMRVKPGESLVVFGTGTVGLSSIMAARLVGASEIIAVDLHARRRELALSLGATHALDGADPELIPQIRDLTAGGACYAIETTGVPEVIRGAIAALRSRGFCALVGVSTQPVELPPNALSGGRVLSYVMEGGAVPQNFIPRMITSWRKGRFPFDALIKTYPLDAINDAERDSGLGHCVKPVLIPGLVRPNATTM